MGCDYYICKFLEINFHYSISPLRIELSSDRGYFYFNLDEDDPDYDEKYELYVQETLESKMKPILIYDYHTFLSLNLESKYKSLIEDELNKYNSNREHKKEWKDITNIKKIETRWERD
jgi:hypothetical protein